METTTKDKGIRITTLQTGRLQSSDYINNWAQSRESSNLALGYNTIHTCIVFERSFDTHYVQNTYTAALRLRFSVFSQSTPKAKCDAIIL